MARPARHVEEDDRFRFRGPMRRPRRERIGAGLFVVQHREARRPPMPQQAVWRKERREWVRWSRDSFFHTLGGIPLSLSLVFGYMEVKSCCDEKVL